MAVTRWSILTVLLALVSGCSQDLQRTADTMVAYEFLRDGTHVRAIPFFLDSGRYYEQETSDSTSVDQQIVLPMLKDLNALCPLAQWVVPDKKDPKLAFAVLVELPDDTIKVDAMAKIVESADAKFDGMILQQWGHKWLSLDFIDQETAEFFKQDDPDFDKQR